MKKLLFVAINVCALGVAEAGSTNLSLVVNGVITANCLSNLNVNTLSFTFVPGTTPSTQSTNLTLSCTANTTINQITATSTNGWRLLGANNGEYVAYTISTSEVTGTSSANIASVWSGTSGNNSPVSEANSSFTVNTRADDIVIALNVAPASIPSTEAVDTYSDTVTFTTSF